MMTFRDALKKNMESHGLSLAEVAKRSGVSYEQLKKFMQRESATTNVDDAVKIAAAFETTVNSFLQDHQAEDRIQIAKLYRSLSEQEIALLREIAASRSDPDQDQN